MTLAIGTHVAVKGEPGVIKFIGNTEFSSGIWYGIELDKAKGRNDGSVNGVRYFECNKKDGNFGVFVKEELLKEIPQERRTLRSPVGSGGLQTQLLKAEEQLASSRLQISVLEKHLKKVQERLQDRDSTQEQLTVDRVYLEEENAKLREQLEEIQLKYEEIKVDYQILQEESQLNKQLEEEAVLQASGSPLTEESVQAILAYSKKLENTLASLKSSYSKQEKCYKDIINQLESTISKLRASVNSSSDLEEALREKETLITSLRTQLDSTFDSQQIIEHLNFENQSLNSKITELSKAVEELTELQELSKSLEESQAAVEADLRLQISNLQIINKKDRSTISELEKRNKRIEALIEKYKKSDSTAIQSSPDAEYLKQQIESLNLDIKNLRLDNYSYEIDIKKHESNDIVFENLQDLLGMISPQFKSILGTIISIKRVQSLSKDIHEIFYMEQIDLLNLPLSSKLEAKFCSKVLQNALQSLLMLYEYNFESEHARGHEIIHSNDMKRLDEYLNEIIKGLKNGTYKGFDRVFLGKIISSCLDPMHADERGLLSYTEKMYALCVSENKYIESQIVEEAIKSMKRLLYMDVVTSAVDIEPTLSVLDAVKVEIASLKEKASLNMKRISELPENDDIHIENLETLKSSQSVGDLLFDLLDQLRNFERLEVDFMKGSNEYSTEDLISILGSNNGKGLSEFENGLRDVFTTFKSDIGIEFKSKKIDSCSIYEFLRSKKTSPQLTESNITEKKVYDKLNGRLLEKDRIIDDLNHNVLLLEQNYTSLLENSGKTMEKLRNEIKSLEGELEKTKKKFDEQLELSEKMNKELESMRKTSILFDENYSIGKFSDMISEKKFDEMVFTLELLTNVKQVIDNSLGSKTSSDILWLQKGFTNNTQIRSKKNNNLLRSANYLRDIVMQSNSNYVIDLKGGWKPLARNHKYRILVLKERINCYMNLKKHIN